MTDDVLRKLVQVRSLRNTVNEAMSNNITQWHSHVFKIAGIHFTRMITLSNDHCRLKDGPYRRRCMDRKCIISALLAVNCGWLYMLRRYINHLLTYLLMEDWLRVSCRCVVRMHCQQLGGVQNQRTCPNTSYDTKPSSLAYEPCTCCETTKLERGKNPLLLGFGSARVLPNVRVRFGSMRVQRFEGFSFPQRLLKYLNNFVKWTC